jgi:hypothetical protein
MKIRNRQSPRPHAEHLAFQHPFTSERANFTAPPPADSEGAREAQRGDLIGVTMVTSTGD